MRCYQRTTQTNWIEVALAGAVLVVGSLVYVLDRPPGSAAFFGAILLGQKLPGFFGSIGDSLPTFAHAFAFSVLTAVWLGGGKRAGFVACTIWFGIDCAFELGQHAQIALRLGQLIPQWLEHVPIVAQADSYFLMGTFDVKDLISIGIGAATAYIVTVHTKGRDIDHG